jgi:hypothetical protein
MGNIITTIILGFLGCILYANYEELKPKKKELILSFVIIWLIFYIEKLTSSIDINHIQTVLSNIV